MNSREQFEAVAADWFGLDPEVIALARMADGYNQPKLATAWRWWQFARSGIVVELPRTDADLPFRDFFGRGKRHGVELCIERVRAAGLGVKHG